MNADIPAPDSDNAKSVQAAIIWSITLLATISVVSGVKVGIRRLSEINWLLAQFIAFIFFFQEDTWYLLNVLTQSLGFYLQWLVQLGSWCNAFVNSPAGALRFCRLCTGSWSARAGPSLRRACRHVPGAHGPGGRQRRRDHGARACHSHRAGQH